MRSFKHLIWLSLFIAVVNYSCSGNEDNGQVVTVESDTTNPSVRTMTRTAEAFPDTDADLNYKDTDIIKPKQTDPNALKIEAQNAKIVANNAATYKDGTYMATIDYFNPQTSYRATYTLKIGVEHGWVTRIAFPNDEYMGNDHITPAELDEDGGCNVYGEHGKVYTIQIDNKY
jgi:hypothetical protein